MIDPRRVTAGGRRWRGRVTRARRSARHVLDVRAAGSMHVHSHLESGGPLHVQGWAFVPGDRVTAVVVAVDDVTTVIDQIRMPTPELVSGRGAAAALSGWDAAIHIAPTGPAVTVVATVVTASGLAERIGCETVPRPAVIPDPDPEPVEVPEPEVRPSTIGAIDMPEAGTLEGDVLVVTGWTVTTAPLDRIEIHAGECRLGLARPMGTARPDIAGAFDDVAAPLAGFEFVVDTKDLSGPLTAHVFAGGEVDVLEGPILEPRTGTPPAPVVEGLARIEARSTLSCRRDTSSGLHETALRLLVVTHHLGLGGGQLYLQELLRGLLRDSRISCTIVAPEWGVLTAELEALGAAVHYCGRFATEARAYEAQVGVIGRIAAEARANVALVNTMGAFIGVDVASRRGIPSVWAIHESYSLEQYFHAAYGMGGVDHHVRDRSLAALASASMTVFEADATREMYGPVIDTTRGRTIRYGIDLPAIAVFRAAHERAAIRESLGIAPDDVLLVCLGTIEPRKAQGAIVEAFRRSSADNPRLHLALVGGQPSSYLDAVSEIVERAGLGTRIRIVPVTPDILPWYEAADGLVTLSDVESLPRSVLEAMAFDTPILATAIFGLPEVIHDGVDGLLCGPRDLDQFTWLLARFIDLSDDERSAMGRAAGTKARAQFSATGYQETYRDILDRFATEATQGGQR